MTANQVAYWNMVENRRANLAKEHELNRSNVVKEQLTEREVKSKEARAATQNRLDTINALIGGVESATRTIKNVTGVGKDVASILTSQS